MTSMIHLTLLLLSIAVSCGIAIGYAVRGKLQRSDWLLLGVAASCAGMDLLDVAQLHAWLSPQHSAQGILTLQGMLVALLLGFSITYARSGDTEERPVLQLVMTGACVAIGLSSLIAQGAWLFTLHVEDGRNWPMFGAPGLIAQALLLVATVMAMYNLEATLASASLGMRWRIKFTVLGMFSMLISMLFLFSQSVLYRMLDPAFAPMRSTGVLLGLLLVGYSTFFRGPEARVIISQRLVYKSFVLLAGGVFLLFLALAAYIAQVYHLTIERTVVWSVVLVCCISLGAFLLSQGVRRKALLFLKHHFYKDKYDYRVQWLEFTRRLTSSRTGPAFYEAALTGFCEILGFGGAALVLQDDESQEYRAVALVEMDAAPMRLARDGVLAALLDEERRPVDLQRLQDPRQAPEFAMSDEAAGLASARAAFAVPLFFEDDLIGAIFLCRPIVKDEVYDEEDLDLMDAFARQTTLATLNIRFTEQLAAIQQSEIMGRVSTFIVHDLKNLVYTLSLTVENAKTYLHEPEFQQDMLSSLTNITIKMKTLISQLRPVPSAGEMRVQPLDLTALARETAADIDATRFAVQGPALTVLADRESMRKVLMNLLLNALEASSDGQMVQVEVGMNATPYVLVRDTGCGMDDSFVRCRLFQPFSTTKQSGMGIGLYQSRLIVEAHGGRIDVRSAPGAGSEFTIRLPANVLASAGAELAAQQ